MSTDNVSKHSNKDSQVSENHKKQDKHEQSIKRDQTLDDSFPASDPPSPYPPEEEK